jgi:PD-(D/E)XK endonuclease
MDIRNHKKRGQWAELRFMAKVIELGFQAAKPLGDSAQYDVVLDVGGRFISIQVKSTFHEVAGSSPSRFEVSLLHPSGPNRTYQQSDFDYLAVYYIPKDIWYIIPSAQAAGRFAIRACPGDKQNQWEPYREAWHLLQDRAPAPLQKPGHFNLYGIIEDYVPPPRIRKA